VVAAVWFPAAESCACCAIVAAKTASKLFAPWDEDVFDPCAEVACEAAFVVT
jgi:hypothetical protein